jgi:hypothetical protein
MACKGSGVQSANLHARSAALSRRGPPAKPGARQQMCSNQLCEDDPVVRGGSYARTIAGVVSR